ncbi:MAG: hypothetical protein IAE91_10475 [Ignavibacteriaceae bacterium]|nr:hypothetical protein [Ignavibacteriaceae bacterium]
MKKIAILAYGSLIDNPGFEIQKQTVQIVKGVLTPFNVEYARKSISRNFAPTLTITNDTGSKVKASLFILSDDCSIEFAKDILYRREGNFTGNLNEVYYDDINWLKIEEIQNFEGCESVIYAKCKRNLDNISAGQLAELALRSAKRKDLIDAGRDGVSYLRNNIKNEVITPLTEDYTKVILNKLEVQNLDEAITKLKDLAEELII